nr:hypothetical protein [Tanacetum cinerariifolium]
MISSVTNALVSFMGTVLMLVTIAQHKFFLFKLCQVLHSNILVVKIVGLLMNLTSVNQRIMTIIMSKILAMILILLALTMKQEEKRIEEEQAAKAQNSKIPVCYDDDDDYNSAITLNEPVESLSIGDEHLNTILEEIISTKIDPRHFDAESDLIKSMLNHDSFIIPSSKIDSLLDEFAGELTLFKSIPPRIDETDCYPEEDIHLIERLLYENSFPRPPEEFVFENSNADIESFFPSPILNEDSDSRMEEINLTFTPDDPMPPDIKEDDDDSERDMLIHEELLDNYSLSFLVIESFYFDFPSFSCPPAKPPDVVHYSRKCKDFCQRILSSKSSFPQLQLGINSQPMLKSSYKAEASVIISIPSLVGGVADVVVEIKGTVNASNPLGNNPFPPPLPHFPKKVETHEFRAKKKGQDCDPSSHTA